MKGLCDEADEAFSIRDAPYKTTSLRSARMMLLYAPPDSMEHSPQRTLIPLPPVFHVRVSWRFLDSELTAKG